MFSENLIACPNWYINGSWQTGQIRMTNTADFTPNEQLLRTPLKLRFEQVWYIIKLQLFVCHQLPRSIIFDLSMKRSWDFSPFCDVRHNHRKDKMAPRRMQVITGIWWDLFCGKLLCLGHPLFAARMKNWSYNHPPHVGHTVDGRNPAPVDR